MSLRENEPKFNGVYSRNNLSKIRDRAYKIYLDEYDSIGTHWIALYSHTKNVTYFDCFEEIRKFIGNKKFVTNIYRVQAYNSTICGYFFVLFIDFLLKGKSFLE